VGALGFFFTCFPLFGNQPLSLTLSPAAPAYGKDMLADGLPFAFSGLMFFNYLFPFIFSYKNRIKRFNFFI
jgi:hypothetical protein